MKNYGRKIELHHDEGDVQFIYKTSEKGVYEETLDLGLLLDQVFPHNPK